MSAVVVQLVSSVTKGQSKIMRRSVLSEMDPHERVHFFADVQVIVV